MTARLVLQCDQCGALTDDHYPHPLPLARQLARGIGWSYRRRSSGGAKNRPGVNRVWVDLCPEHTYCYGIWQEPVRGTKVAPPAPLHPDREDLTPMARYADVVLSYEDDIEGQGPYRVYTTMIEGMRGTGRMAKDHPIRLRRELFASGAVVVDVARRWVTVTQTAKETYEQDGREPDR